MLILASTSPYRRELLSRLRLHFDVVASNVDEACVLNESPKMQAQRLAETKARTVAEHHREAWVIGADQVAELNGQALGKPGNFERAADQLNAASGQRVLFHSAVSLHHYAKKQVIRFCDLTIVRFRTLSTAEIERYLHAEQPYDCAGSFKSEGLGITLFDAIESHDPTALIGLPLIALSRALRQTGLQLP